jgi:enoyl-[acyl-carrier protein] reductase III
MKTSVWDGKVALVTGGGRGLGRAIVRKLAAGGCDVYLNYVNDEASAKQTVADTSDLPGRVYPVRTDVSVPAELPRLFDEIRKGHNRLDIMVHNAATFRPMSAAQADLAAFHAEQALALNPLLAGAPALIELMAPTGAGRVVVISSNGAGRAIPGYVAVGVAKAALESLVRYLAVELAGRQITVNTIATALLDKGGETANPQMVAALAQRTPAGRLTRPEDVADAVALLCTDDAHWIHGQVVTVDGGLGLRA